MPHVWPSETAFRRVELDVKDRVCERCRAHLHVCAHRERRVFTLDGPWLLVVRLVPCPEAGCPGHRGTISPAEEMGIALPRLTVGWDVFAWIGHRRFARHWSVPQICGELSDSYRIDLSEDAVEKYLRRYQAMVAARHADEQEVLRQSAEDRAGDAGPAGVAAAPSAAGPVVLEYCAAVRGILNDDQGGPLHPPGLRMAQALQDVQQSLQRNLGAKKGGPRKSRCSV